MTTLARIRSRCFGFEMLVHLYNHPLATYPLIHRVICIADILSLYHRTVVFRYGGISISDPFPHTLEHHLYTNHLPSLFRSSPHILSHKKKNIIIHNYNFLQSTVGFQYCFALKFPTPPLYVLAGFLSVSRCTKNKYLLLSGQ